MRSPPAPVRLHTCLRRCRRATSCSRRPPTTRPSRSVWLGEDGILAGSPSRRPRHVGDAVARLGRRARRRLPRRRPGVPRHARHGRPCRGRGRHAGDAGGGEGAALEAIDEVLAAVSSRCAGLRGRQRHEVQAVLTLCRRSTSSDSARRCAGPRCRARPRRRRPGARRPSRWSGHPDGGRPISICPEGELRLVVGTQGSAPRAGDGGRRTRTDARRRGTTAGRRGGRGMGRSRLDRGQRRAPGHRPAHFREGLTARFGDCVGSRMAIEPDTKDWTWVLERRLSGVRVRRIVRVLRRRAWTDPYNARRGGDPRPA